MPYVEFGCLPTIIGSMPHTDPQVACSQISHYLRYLPDKPLEMLYAAYLANDIDKYPIGLEYAAGFHQFLALDNLLPMSVKGHVTGPVTWGLTVTDSEGKGILYDDILGDAVPKLLRLKAAWQEKELRQMSKNTIIFVDEPYGWYRWT